MDYETMANEELAVLAKEGDRHAEEVLYTHVQRLIYRIMNKYISMCQKAGIERDDMEQECYFGFHRAIDGYEVGSSLFTSYLGFHIKGACLRYALSIDSRGKMKPLPVSLSTPTNGEDEDTTIEDMIIDESIDITGGAELTDLQRVVRGAVERLTEREQSLIHSVYYRKESAAEWGRSEGICNSRAAQVHHKALRKLKRDRVIQSLEPFYVKEQDKAAERNARWYSLDDNARQRIDKGISLYLAWCSDNSITPNVEEHRRRLAADEIRG